MTIAARITTAVLVAGTVMLAGCGSGLSGYQNAAVLQHALKGDVTRRLEDKSGQYYAPGVHVSKVSCIEQSKTSATCLIELSNGDSSSDSVVISSNGNEFITK